MKKILLPLFLLITWRSVHSQSVGIGITNPHASAILDVNSSSKGFLPPRMSWPQIQAIPNPAAGLMVYDTGIKALRLYNGSKWIVLSEKEKGLADAPGSYTETTQGGNGIAYPNAIAMGPDKSVYIAGAFNYSPSIGSFNLNEMAMGDVFFGKFDSLGTPVWIKTLRSSSIESATGIAIDAAGNIYISGFFLTAIDLDPGPGISNLTSSGSYDGFYAKYDNNGDLLWGKKIGGTGYEKILAITTDGSSLYMTGHFNGQATFNSVVLTSFGGDDIFIARYQCSNGNMGASGWAGRMGGILNDAGNDIQIYGGNIIVGGSFEGSANFAGTIKTSYGLKDGFISTHTAASILLDINQMGGAGNDVVNTVAEDLPTATIFAAGSFSSTADFDDRPAVTLSKTSNGGTDAFIMRYQAGFPVWVNTFGAASNEEVKAIDSDELGNIYAIGGFSGTVLFNLFPLISTGGLGAYLLKVDAGGNILWVQQAGGLSSDYGEDLAVSSNGKFLFASCTIFSNPWFTFNNTQITGEGFYLARYEE